MSYILDALKRAEQERQLGQAPNAAAAVVTDNQQQEQSLWPWLLLAVLLLAAAGAVSAYWLASLQYNAPESAPLAASSEPLAAAVKEINSAAKTRSPLTSAATLPTRVTAVAPQAQLTARPQQHTETTKSTASRFETSPSVSASSINTVDISATKTSPDIPPATPAAAIAVKTEPAKKAPTATSPASDEDNSSHSLPWLEEMSYDFRQSLPRVEVQFHRHTENSSRSFVMVDGVRYREGQILKSGPVVERIVEEGLLLRWQGQRFVYPLGN